MTRVIYKCTRKACNKVRRVEYPHFDVVRVGVGMYERKGKKFFRLDEKRGKVFAGNDFTCECGGHCTQDVIKGFKTEHVCDARCTGATGHNCECSCGGANHGKDYQAAA